MPELLERAGFRIRSAKRADCARCTGHSRATVSFTSEVAFCHRCGWKANVLILARDLGLVRHHTKIRRRKKPNNRTEAAAWALHDGVVLVRGYYADALRRTERLQARIGERLRCARDADTIEAAWPALTRLAPISTFFRAGFNFVFDASPKTMAHFILASPEARRKMVFEGCDE